MVEEPHQSGIHPQVEAAAEKEGEAGVPYRSETAGLRRLFRGINHTKTAPDVCVLYGGN